MQKIAATLVVLRFVMAIGVLFFFLTTKSIEYVERQEVMAAEELQLKIDELLAQSQVSLIDFIEEFGEPDSVNNVTCQGDQRCLRARWDFSTRFVQCWKRLEIVINDETDELVYSEVQELTELKVEEPNGQKTIICVYR